MLAAKTDNAFKAFLDARNPTKQHSSTLESYLIKPVQRVLKYPLLLRELVSLMDHDSEEHYHLTGEAGARSRGAAELQLAPRVPKHFSTTIANLRYNFSMWKKLDIGPSRQMAKMFSLELAPSPPGGMSPFSLLKGNF